MQKNVKLLIKRKIIMEKITGLYQNTSKKTGEIFLCGTAKDGTKYFVFQNKKQKDSHPDFNLSFEAPDEAKDSAPVQQSNFFAAQSRPANQHQTPASGTQFEENDDDNDLPF